MGKSKNTFKYIIGIDEAGRGPIAGPLALGFVKFQSRNYLSYKKRKNSLPSGIDSKKLTPKKREDWFMEIKKLEEAGRLESSVVFIKSESIDKKGIRKSLDQAVVRGLRKISADSKDCQILLDGSLYAPEEFSQKTIIKGDEKEKIIGLASILAKVSRDGVMSKAHLKYPKFNFDKHKGYGTRSHYEAIKQNGICPLHRKSFLKGVDLSL